jgi:hypothetical protein
MRSRIIIFSILISVLPFIAEALGTPRTFRELASQVVDFLSASTATLILLGVVYYVWGIASHFSQFGEGNWNAFRSHVIWGILILFFMVSIWGILNVLRSTLFQEQSDRQIVIYSR